MVSPVLLGLAYKRIATICYAAHFDDAAAARFAGTSVRVSRQPVDLPTVLRDCTAAVTHGGHGTVCELFRAGVPQLTLPQSLEQQVTGDRLKVLGVGRCANPNDLNAVATHLEELLDADDLGATARSVAAALPAIEADEALQRLVDELTSIPDE